MNKKDKLFLRHIKDSCKYILEFKQKINKEEFKKNRLYQDGIIREIEIIGEAASKVSENLKSKYKEILWKDIIGMRNKIIHEYFGIDLDIIWKTTETDIPDLLEKIKRILKKA